MADIFISYSREDRDKNRQLASALEANGWTVFWDRTIPPGKTWREYIGAELHSARCVIVAWSKTSVESEWVMEEADEGKNRKILVPVLFDEIQPPLGFRSLHFGDLTNWGGDQESYNFKLLVASVSEIIGAKTETPPDGNEPSPPESDDRTPQKQFRQTSVAASGHNRLSVKKLAPPILVAALIFILLGVWYMPILDKRKNIKIEVDRPEEKQSIDCNKRDPNIACLFQKAMEKRK